MVTAIRKFKNYPVGYDTLMDFLKREAEFVDYKMEGECASQDRVFEGSIYRWHGMTVSVKKDPNHSFSIEVKGDQSEQVLRDLESRFH